METARESAQPPRYTHRLVTLEEERVVDRLQAMAIDAGHSLSSEVRSAIRYWLRAFDAQDADEQEDVG